MSNKIATVREALTYDDVSLVPLESNVLPADVSLKTQLTKKITLHLPFLSAAMDTVSEAKMAIAMANLGGMSIIHKNLSTEDQAAEVAKVKAAEVTGENAVTDTEGRLLVGAAVGVGAQRDAQVAALVEAGVDIVCVDTAHGHSAGVINAVKAIRTNYPELPIMAGNIVTAEAVRALAEAGVDCVKVGVGPGSICTTRVVAGVGVPQLTAVADCAEAAEEVGVTVIADGGIRYSGDIVKAIGAGAQMAMLGSVLAATEASPGEVIEQDGKKFKSYRGMGSLGAMEKGSKDRYFQGNVNEKKKLVPEGIEGMIPYKGTTEEVVHQLIGGLRSGMGYTGSATIDELRERAQFVKITNAGARESHPHDVTITKAAPNY